MIQTVEALIDEDGTVSLLEAVRLPSPRRALVTILEEPAAQGPETALLSEAALAKDWKRPQEDEAWSHLSRMGRDGAIPVLGLDIFQSEASSCARGRREHNWVLCQVTSNSYADAQAVLIEQANFASGSLSRSS